MKNIATLLLGVFLMLSVSHTVLAVEKSKTKVSYVKQRGEMVHFSLTSSKPFIFGSNKYYLHIGDKEFTRAEQSKSNGKGRLTFLIPSSDFQTLKDGTGIFLTYGEMPADDDAAYEEMAKENTVKCWSLGKFNKSMLAK